MADKKQVPIPTERLRKLRKLLFEKTGSRAVGDGLMGLIIHESSWARKESGKNNLSGLKENDISKGELVVTRENFSSEKEKQALIRGAIKRGGKFIKQTKANEIKIIDRFKSFESDEAFIKHFVGRMETQFRSSYNKLKEGDYKGFVFGLKDQKYYTDSASKYYTSLDNTVYARTWLRQFNPITINEKFGKMGIQKELRVAAPNVQAISYLFKPSTVKKIGDVKSNIKRVKNLSNRIIKKGEEVKKTLLQK